MTFISPKKKKKTQDNHECNENERGRHSVKIIVFRVLSHLVRLPGLNPSWMLPLLDCVHTVLLDSEPQCICIIKAAAVYSCCLVTTTQEVAAKCIALLNLLLYFGL